MQANPLIRYVLVNYFVFLRVLGSLAYFLAIYLPETRLERNLQEFGAKAAHKLNPGTRAARGSISV